jgi:protein TonB
MPAAAGHLAEMRRQGIAGEVLVEFLIDARGDVHNAFAAHSSWKEFEAAAIQAVAKWKFRPGRKGGRNVVTRMQVPMVFSLNE